METKHYKRVAMLAYIVAALVLIGLAIFLVINLSGSGQTFGCSMVNNVSGLSLENPAPYQASGVYMVEPETIDSIRIDWVSGSLEIRAEEQGAIEISETRSGDKEGEALGYEIKDGELRITYFRDPSLVSLFNFSPRPKNLTVLLPLELAKHLKEVRIDTASTDLAISGIRADILDIEKVSGNATIADVTLSELKIDGTSGDATIQGSIDEIRLNSVSGNNKIALNNLFKRIDVDTVSGNLELRIPKDSDLGIKRDSVSGSMTSAIGYSESGAQQLDIDSVSGDLRIEVIDD